MTHAGDSAARARLPPSQRGQPIRTAGSTGSWQLAVELPVEIGINGEPVAVMLATPADVEELALGFLHTEHLLHAAQPPHGATGDDAHGHDAHGHDVHVDVQLDGIVVDVRVPQARVNTRARALRRLEGRTGCGLCGIESLAALRGRAPEPLGARAAVPDDAALARAFTALPDAQPLNRATHSVHAAAWCAADGTLRLVREDVGRHNALDKLVGARLRAAAGGWPEGPGFVLMSSRLSYELVYKAHALGAACLATISAPTSLAVDTAALLGLELACIAGRDADGTPRIARFPAPRTHAAGRAHGHAHGHG